MDLASRDERSIRRRLGKFRPLQLAYQFSNLDLRQPIRLASHCCRPIEPAKRTPVLFLLGLQVSAPLQSVKHRIERPRAQCVAVTREFLNHPLAVKFRLRGMMQNMQTNQALQELLVLHRLGHCCLDPWRRKKARARFRGCACHNGPQALARLKSA